MDCKFMTHCSENNETTMHYSLSLVFLVLIWNICCSKFCDEFEILKANFYTTDCVYENQIDRACYYERNCLPVTGGANWLNKLATGLPCADDDDDDMD